DGQCLALCAAVRDPAGAQRGAGRSADYLGVDPNGASAQPSAATAVWGTDDGAFCAVFHGDGYVAGGTDLCAVGAVYVALHRVMVQRAGGYGPGGGAGLGSLGLRRSA